MTGFPAPGQVLGRYRIERWLGHGGMGVVYEATDTLLGRTVALKALNPSYAASAEYRSRFTREAALLARLDSPRIVSIYDLGEEDGRLYLVTQLIHGVDLQQWVATHGPMPPVSALDVMAQVCEGLAAAHAVGVVHRDVKPSNVLLRGRGGGHDAYLCDFGIATTAETGHTRDGLVVGSAAYMAPERHQGLPADARGDVYSVGCVLWHALTGGPPYQGSDLQVALAHVRDPCPQLDEVNPFASAVNAVLAKAMAKEPADRHRSAEALSRDLTALAAIAPGNLVHAAGDGSGRPSSRPPGHSDPAAPPPPPPGPDQTKALPHLAPAATPAPAPAPPPESGPALPRRARAAAAAIGVVLLLGGVTYLGASMVTSDEPPDRSASSSPSGPGRDGAGQAGEAGPPRWRCWDGTRVAVLADCPSPSGERGLAWVFPSFWKAPRVKEPYPPGRVTPAWRQPYTVDGRPFFIRYNRWNTRATAVKTFEGIYDNPRRRWTVGGVDYGVMWRLTKREQIFKPGHFAFTMDGLYAGTGYGWTIGSNSQPGLDLGLEHLEARPPAQMRGVRLR